jgi:hypothetical protein
MTRESEAAVPASATDGKPQVQSVGRVGKAFAGGCGVTDSVFLRLLLGLALPGPFVACSTSGRRETAILIDAVDRYRQTPEASKLTQAQDVAAVSCGSAAVCEAKRVCLEAMDPTTRGARGSKTRWRHGSSDIEHKRLDPAAPEAASLPASSTRRRVFSTRVVRK